MVVRLSLAAVCRSRLLCSGSAFPGVRFAFRLSLLTSLTAYHAPHIDDRPITGRHFPLINQYSFPDFEYT